jgi:hypothetical protein
LANQAAIAPGIGYLHSYSGHSLDPATPGQGLFVEFNRIAEASFVAWYTYAADGASQDVLGQRWY